jgi:hypothetical protein
MKLLYWNIHIHDEGEEGSGLPGSTQLFLPGPALHYPALPGPARPCPTLPGPALPGPALPGPVLPGPALPCDWWGGGGAEGRLG